MFRLSGAATSGVTSQKVTFSVTKLELLFLGARLLYLVALLHWSLSQCGAHKHEADLMLFNSDLFI